MEILVPLADGFEEVEAVSIIDILRRGDINVVTASLHDRVVTGSHKIPVTADISLGGDDLFDGIILPGGMRGSANLKKDPRIIKLVKEIHSQGGIASAICAAPTVLAAAGILEGKKFTCYPGYEDEIKNGVYIPEPVVQDGNIITGKGAACAVPFALKIVEVIKGKEVSGKLKEQMMAFW